MQGGWLRANERKLDAAKSTLLEPVLSLRESDVAPMPKNKFTEVTIPLYYQGHVYRAGSRIRVRSRRPTATSRSGRSSETDPAGQANVAIGYGSGRPSRLILPVVPGGPAPTGAPAVPGSARRAVP